jgi:integrase
MHIMQLVDYFLDSLESKHSKEGYQYHWNRYLKFGTPPSKQNARLLTDHIIAYLTQMKGEGLSYSYRNGALAAIKHHYTMVEDVILNWKKISKFLRKKKFDNSLRAYTHEEIAKLLKCADVKYQAIILLYASSGMRREALTELKIKDFNDIEVGKDKIYWFKIYKNTDEEQFCFTTPEAAKAIKLYIEDKNPGDYFHNVEPKSISMQLRKIAIAAGVSQKHKLTRGETHGQFRSEIPATQGLRKFAENQMYKTRIGIMDMKTLIGHSTGREKHYLEFPPEDLLQEYVKCIPLLTISEEEKLSVENKRLEAKSEQIVSMVDKRLNEKDKEIQELKDMMRMIFEREERDEKAWRRFDKDSEKYPGSLKASDNLKQFYLWESKKKKNIEFNKRISDASASILKDSKRKKK